jgi:hypothetical protein
MKAILPGLGLAAVLGFALTPAAVAGGTRPVVVELFTSQSCSSCPPADALLGELAARPDVLALGFHVTYWNNTGWKDTLSRQDSTDRQLAYDRRLTGGQMYTPQIVIDGTDDVVGSDRSAVLAALGAAKPVTAAPVGFAADRRSVSIGQGSGTAGATVLLVRFVRSRVTQVGAGENANRTARDTNGVSALSPLGGWNGNPVSFPIDPPGEGEGVAVLVQAADGKILGAGSI